MAVSVPDPRSTASDTGRVGQADAPAHPTERAADQTRRNPDTPSSDRTGRDTENARSSEGQDSGSGPRSAAEWVTLAISSLIVLGLFGLVTYFYLTNSDAPAIVEVEPRLSETYQAGS